MYLPKYFSEEDLKVVSEVIQQNPFVVISSLDPKGEPIFSHIPILVKNEGSRLVLVGHYAKRNPQWSHFAQGSKAWVVVNGPHTYITPTWYRSGRDVPTWNYVAIHLEGRVRLIPEAEGMKRILKELTDRFEAGSPSPWEFEMPDDLLDDRVLESAIVGFEIDVEKFEAKFKLSQNRSQEDKAGVMEGLKQRTDENSLHILKWMQAKS